MIKFTQKKTKGAEVLPIPHKTVKLLGEKREPDAKVIPGLDYSALNNIKLREWVYMPELIKG